MYRSYQVEEYYIQKEPFYLPVGDEVEIFEAAYKQKLPVLLKGPTGCGKTRFVEYMSYRLGRLAAKVNGDEGAENSSGSGIPLMTIACHEDLTASDLVGRYLLEGDQTKWMDGPLARAVKTGAICYLDEVVEARKDTTVLIHPLTDHRRILPVEKRGEILEAHEGFQLVLSYNPGYQSALKDLKHSTRQRFVALEFTHPNREIEAQILEHEAGLSKEMSESLAKLGEKVRNLKDHGLQEGVSTRLLIYTGKLIASGISARRACQVAVTAALTDDYQVQRGVDEVVFSIFE
jgi:nitric oxide reductase NorQ protein